MVDMCMYSMPYAIDDTKKNKTSENNVNNVSTQAVGLFMSPPNMNLVIGK